jgi:hypothetical protein
LARVPGYKKLLICWPILSGKGNMFLHEKGIFKYFKKQSITTNICHILDSSSFLAFTTFNILTSHLTRTEWLKTAFL